MARSKELEEKIIELYNSGLSMAAVGREVGKSSTVVFTVLNKYNLPKISKDMMPHLIRGLVDGDDCITITHSNGLPRLAISFCGNETLVTQLRDYLVKELKIHNAAIEHIQPNLWQISWGGKNDCLKICEYIYQDATFYLTRKKDKYLKMSKYYDNTEVI